MWPISVICISYTYMVVRFSDRTHIAVAVADRKLISLSVVQRVPVNIVSSGESLTMHEENGHENEMKPLPQMKAPRCAFGAASFDDKIVVAGTFVFGRYAGVVVRPRLLKFRSLKGKDQKAKSESVVVPQVCRLCC